MVDGREAAVAIVPNERLQLMASHPSRVLQGSAPTSLKAGELKSLAIELLGHRENPDIVTLDRVIARARELLASVSFDNDGIMIGHQRQGGNGGLLSTDSTKAADQLRLALEALDSPAEVTS